MTSRERAEQLRNLEYHLDKYRHARRAVSLSVTRMQPPRDLDRDEVSFHAIGVCEAIDRLNGRTR